MDVTAYPCTACGANESSGVFFHPHLRAPVCRACLSTYLGRDWGSLDASVWCRWCGQRADNYFECDRVECRFVYCHGCVTRNCASGKAAQINEMPRWYCFICDPQQNGMMEVVDTAVEVLRSGPAFQVKRPAPVEVSAKRQKIEEAVRQANDSASDPDSDLEDEPLGERELEDEPILPAPIASMLESAEEIKEETADVPAVGLQFDWELLMSGEEVHEDDFKTVST
mmetsp:Transcript_98740/g.264021  ORF Transcript_98740/g.264021 Transcript_98740/m.264021 type:complete len:226 (-) Transcript_98740:39-716(-)